MKINAKKNPIRYTPKCWFNGGGIGFFPQAWRYPNTNCSRLAKVRLKEIPSAENIKSENPQSNFQVLNQSRGQNPGGKSSETYLLEGLGLFVI